MPGICRLILLAALGACSLEEAPLAATDVVITQPPPGLDMAAVYLSLRNSTAQEIRITRVTSPQLGPVTMHESTHADGIARMRPLPELVIPAGATLSLEPGARHLMLDFGESSAQQITLQFFSADTLLLSVDVRPQE